eukprot:11226515-Lingulodinium_polyedra.AAC.1
MASVVPVVVLAGPTAPDAAARCLAVLAQPQGDAAVLVDAALRTAGDVLSFHRPPGGADVR